MLVSFLEIVKFCMKFNVSQFDGRDQFESNVLISIFTYGTSHILGARGEWNVFSSGCQLAPGWAAGWADQANAPSPIIVGAPLPFDVILEVSH